MRDQDYVKTEVEFYLDTENPYEIHITIKAPVKMNGKNLYDALYELTHGIIEPEVFGEVRDCKDLLSN